MHRKLVAAISVVGAAMLGTAMIAGPANAIVGGQPATQRYPFMASLSIDVGGVDHFTCGGSLITPDVVETNAHCVALKEQPVTAAELRIRVGSDSDTAGGTVVGVDAIIVNPKWDEDTAGGDIALLKLTRSVPYRPIPIALRPPSPGDQVRSIGFGCTVEPDACTRNTLPATLQQLDSRVVASHLCTGGMIHASEFCNGPAQDGGQQCAGDSGSPVMVSFFGQWFLAGSVSRDGDASPTGPGSCHGQTGVDVSMTDYLMWIVAEVWQTERERVATS
ncbi:MAG TPA: serine protease [Pseudonocardiaceae bacterium]|jgi:secreted trypsin-like serine protease|nr:serine protease [Pseudonocardiaceae bacterium]